MNGTDAISLLEATAEAQNIRNAASILVRLIDEEGAVVLAYPRGKAAMAALKRCLRGSNDAASDRT